jgi:3-hydroxybutyryl-CoA dehydrogenase
VAGPHQVVPAVVVVGPGVMGRAVASRFADAGLAVTLVGPRGQAPDLRHPGVTAADALPAGVPDLVVEAVFEDAAVKRAVFAEVEGAYGGRPVLATNTSSLPLEALAGDLAHPDRFLGLHFFMPADACPLVEVVRTAATADAAVDTTLAALRRAGAEAVVLRRPVVGYLVNRLQHAILREAYALIEQGVVRPEEVDRVAKRLLGPRMCVTGLIEQKDIAGLGVHAAAQREIVPTLASDRAPSRLLQALAAGGDRGVETGRGFYDWTGRDPEVVRRHAAARLARLVDFLEGELGEGDRRLAPRPR